MCGMIAKSCFIVNFGMSMHETLGAIREVLLASNPDDTGVHQFLNLGADAGVLEMLLQRRGVVLGLLKDSLHDGVLEDANDLSVC